MLAFPDKLTNRATTLNGAASNASSLSAVLDLFSMGVSAATPLKQTLLKKAFEEDPYLTIKVVFYLRDCRGGQGNKDILQVFLTLFPELSPALVQYISEFGSYKDLRKLYTSVPSAQSAILQVFSTDIKAGNQLAGKWAPRKGPLAAALAKSLNLTSAGYRHTIVKLSNTVEQLMCARKWSDIPYKSVPSCANKLYSKAFWRHDADRYGGFVQKVIKGETTMKSSRLYPHEILSMITRGNGYNLHKPPLEASRTADALWKSLPNYMTDAHNVLPVIDMSGSMTSKAHKDSTVSCMDIAMGLGFYFAEHNTGSYKNLWCHFSDTIKAQYLKGETLSQYIANFDRQGMGYSTNLQAVFNFILEHHKSTSDVPSTILIVSDMEFNSSDVSGARTNFDTIKAKFKAAGVTMPLLVFWRVGTSTVQQPVILTDKNTILLNGYSPAVCQSIFNLNAEDITPYSMMIKALGTKYDKVLADIQF